jgi:hypothetical protein
VLDQAANGQGADARGSAGLIVGQAVGDGDERALLIGDELVQRVAFVADGWCEGRQVWSYRFEWA